MIRLHRMPMLLVASVLVAGCAVKPSAQSPSINLSGFPQAFKQGYADGCESARGSTTRDNTRFKSDLHYAQGWRDGLDICRRR